MKVYDLTTRNVIMMTLTRIMYLNKTFHLAKNIGVTHRAQEGVNEKALKMAQKVSFLTLSLKFNANRHISDSLLLMA